MIELNLNVIAIIVAGLVPNILGALYYGPIFGKTWRAAIGKTEEELTPSNPAIVYGSALLMGLIVSFFINFILQMGHKNVDAAGNLIVDSHNTFGHGAFHGTMLAVAFAMPVIVSLGLFHKSSAKTNLLNVVFWIVCFAVMGGILDVWQ